MVTITPETGNDIAAREALLDRAFGRNRKRKASERLREGRLAAEELSFAARDCAGRLIGTVRLWNVTAGSAGPALLLGPLAVDRKHQNRGIGAALMRHAVAEARRRGHRAILLVGDEPYYGRFGFRRSAAAGLAMPGPVEANRFLGLELEPKSLAGATGVLAAAGQMAFTDVAERLTA